MEDRFGPDLQDVPGAGLDGLGARIIGAGDPVFLESGCVVRQRWPRMTIRLLIMVVALAAFATEAGLVAWRAVTYRKRADDHAQYLNSGHSFLYDSTELRQWHERMRRKYERGASFPWLPIEPEPPPE